MTRERWQQVKEIFDGAQSLPAAERGPYLNTACGDPAVRQEVEALLAVYDEAENFIEEPAAGKSVEALVMEAPDPLVGRRVGPYRVLDVIAEGGMGMVYRAARVGAGPHGTDGEPVALKLVRAGLDTVPLLRRFKHERQILAALTHPNVARLLDAGLSDDGRPYFVMEYIHGQPIDTWCVEQSLTVRDRVSLFIPVCGAVEAAHQLQVIHRDIKPGNILVTPSGVPKLLDFGIAKALDPSLATGGSEATATLMRLMTPEYASPEQVRGGAATPATDVYSLGVLLYELLAGQRPYRLSSRSAVEVARVVGEQMPESPSAAASRAGDRKLCRALSGDLDCIVLRAMAKEPSRRYPSAQALADDLQRHLDGRPIAARRDTVAYRTSRWVQRHRTATIAAGVCLATSLVAGGTLLWRGQPLPLVGALRGAAPAVARPSVAVLGFKNVSARPQVAWLSTAFAEMLTTELAAGEQLRIIPGENVARLKLELALADADSFARDTLSRIHRNLGSDYVVLGSYTVLGQGDSRTIRLDIRLQDTAAGETLALAGGTGTEAEMPRLIARVASQLREKLGVRAMSPGEADQALGTVSTRPEAYRFYVEGLTLLRRSEAGVARDLLVKSVAADPQFPLAHAALAAAWLDLGFEAQAREEAQQAVALSKSLSREDRMVVDGQYRETLRDWDRAIAIYRELARLFPDSPDYGLRLVAMQNAAGRSQEAMSTVEELRARTASLRDDPRLDLAEAETARQLANWKRVGEAAERATKRTSAQGARLLLAHARLLAGDSHHFRGDSKAAAAPYEEASRLYAAAGDRDGMAASTLRRGLIRQSKGDLRGAQRDFHESLRLYREIGNQRGISTALHHVGVVHGLLGEREDATRVLQEGLTTARTLGDPRSIGAALLVLADAHRENGELTAAEPLLTEARAVFEKLNDGVGRGRVAIALGAARLEAGRVSEAEGLIRGALGSVAATGAYEEFLANGVLADVLRVQGRLDDARRLYDGTITVKRDGQDQAGLARASLHLGEAAALAGDLSAAYKHLEEAVALGDGSEERATAALARACLSRLFLLQGHALPAEQLARQAAEELRPLSARTEQAVALAALAETLAAQGKTDAAQQVLLQAAPLLQRIESQEPRVRYVVMSARVRAAKGHVAEALAQLETLLKSPEGREATVWRWEARLAQAEIEMRNGQAAAGRAHLEQLQSETRAQKAEGVARRAAALLRL